MKKYTENQKKDILKQYDYKKLKQMTYREAYDLLKDLFPVGTKFRNSLWDKDVWHVISYIEDGNKVLIVVKSWAKYKQRWVYKVVNIASFLYEMHLASEL